MKKAFFFLLLIISGLRVNAQVVSDSTLTASRKDLTTFIKIINTAGLQNVFNSQPVTIFAPDNKAFDKLSAGKLDSLLMPANKATLITLLNSHIIPGKLTAQDIAKMIHASGQAIFTGLAGTKLTAKINGNRNIVLDGENGGEAIIKTFDITKGNAGIFIIDSVILPKK